MIDEILKVRPFILQPGYTEQRVKPFIDKEFTKVITGQRRVGKSYILFQFAAKKAGNVKYIQVVYMLADENTMNREFGNLLKIKDNYPKYVVTMDEYNAGNNYKGIEQVHLKDFLLMNI